MAIRGRNSVIILCLTMATVQRSLAGEPFKEASFTQVVNDVQIVEGQTHTSHPATLHSKVEAPEVVQTGPQSRAELKFADDTVTRIGANTSFSMVPTTRGINLQSGSILFHSPTGKGGGTIQTAAATAAVTGTTIIVSATSNGGFKVMVLEGKCNIHPLHGGRSFDINAGQLTFMMPGQTSPTPPIEFRLDLAVGGSGLVQGFSTSLDSLGKIQVSIDKQNKDINSGKAESTGILVGDAKTKNSFETFTIDPSILVNTLPNSPSNPNSVDPNLQLILNALQVDATLANNSDLYQKTLQVKLSTILTALSKEGDASLQADQYTIAGVFAKNLSISADSLDLSNASSATAFGFIANGTLTLPENLTLENAPAYVYFYGNTLSLHPVRTFLGEEYETGTYSFPDGSNVEFNANNLDQSQINDTTFNYSNANLTFEIAGTSPITFNNLDFENDGDFGDLNLNMWYSSNFSINDSYFFSDGYATGVLSTGINSGGNLNLYDNDFYDSGSGVYFLSTYSAGDTTSDYDYFLYDGSGTLVMNSRADGNLTFENDYFLGDSYEAGSGSLLLLASAGNDLTFSQCTFASGVGGSIVIDASAGGNITFDGCTFDPAYEDDYSIYASSPLTITYSGCSFNPPSSGTSVDIISSSNNSLTQFLDSSFNLYGCELTVIGGNDLTFSWSDSSYPSFSTQDFYAYAYNNLNFSWGNVAGDFNVQNADLNAGNDVNFNWNLSGTLYATGDIDITAGHDVNFTSSGTSAIVAQNVNITAGNQISMSNIALDSVTSTLRMNATTVTLNNVSIPAGLDARFSTQTGNWRAGPSISAMAGHLNLINSTYGGTEISTVALSNGASAISGGAGGGPGTIPGTTIQSLVK